MKKKVLITGCAGFIGFHLCKRLLSKNFCVIGIDNLNSYYDISLKKDRLSELKKYSKDRNKIFNFLKTDIRNRKKITNLFKKIDLKKFSILLLNQVFVSLLKNLIITLIQI